MRASVTFRRSRRFSAYFDGKEVDPSHHERVAPIARPMAAAATGSI